MTQVVLFHHAQGLTEGCRALADSLRAAGHGVHVPDLYEGETFSELSAGVGHAEAIGFDTVIERGRLAAQSLPADAVYIGISLGVLPAQLLAQTRDGALGAVLISGAVPPSALGGAWPAGVALQIHMMDADPLVLDEGDLATARELADTVEQAELFLYPGDRHLFIDQSLSSYDREASERVIERITRLLNTVS